MFSIFIFDYILCFFKYEGELIMIKLLEMLENAVDDVYITSYHVDIATIKIKTIRDAEEPIEVGWLKNSAGIEGAKRYIKQLRSE